MRHVLHRPFAVPALLAWAAAPLAVLALAAAPARAAESPNGVHDNAKLFKPETIQKAEATIRDVKQAHAKDVLIETYPSLPGAPTGEGATQQRNQFFNDWMQRRGQSLKVTGMMVLIVMQPPHVQTYVGASTRSLFPDADKSEIEKRLVEALGNRDYDNALVRMTDMIKDRMDRYDPKTASVAAGASAAADAPIPAPSSPPASRKPPSPSTGGFGFGIGGLVCLVIAAVIVFGLIRMIFGNRGQQQGGYGPGGGYGRPGYGPGPGQGYGPGPSYGPGPGYGPGYGQPGGGGGFGKGMLGGLFGGLLGGYAADKFMHRNDPGPTGGHAAGGGYSPGVDPNATSGSDFGPGGSSEGADFGTGGGGGYTSGGSDFDAGGSSSGFSSGGSDYSSGGSDFGGGGGGSDFGGGGSDFGGGGDSGSSGGSDF